MNLKPVQLKLDSDKRHFVLVTEMHTCSVPGKSCGKESPDKKDDNELWSNVEAQAAFLGPNLWEKTLSYDSDLKVSNPLTQLFVSL